jgi:chromosomal replication initiation ATPase DnaA
MVTKMMPTFDFFLDKNIFSLQNFVVHDGNRIAFEFVTTGSVIENNVFLITGAKGSGKTYLCEIWKKINNGRNKFVMEDIEKTFNRNDLFYHESEERLLHYINNIIEQKGILLITSTKLVNEFNFDLPDLQSRFRNIYNIIIENFDADIKKQILLKLLNDKQLNLSNGIIDYIANNSRNDYESIINVVEKINRIDKINIANIKKIL